jgi:hypothetical protein
MNVRSNASTTIAVIGSVFFAVILLFPPWKYVLKIDTSDVHVYIEQPGPHAFILTPPSVPITGKSSDGKDTYMGKTASFFSVSIDNSRLAIWGLSACALFVVPYLAIRARNNA